MTIEFHCPHCDKVLKTADDKAGVEANCPGCGERVLVPAAAEGGARYDQSFAADSPSRSSGGSAPPTSSAGTATKACPMCGEQIMAAATRCRYCGEDLSSGVSRRGRLAAHRGGMILAFGIIGFVICFPFGIAAWVMGNNDLREMADGRMDPSGEGLTKAGKIIGIVTVCMQLLWIGIFALMMVVSLVANVNR